MLVHRFISFLIDSAITKDMYFDDAICIWIMFVDDTRLRSIHSIGHNRLCAFLMIAQFEWFYIANFLTCFLHLHITLNLNTNETFHLERERLRKSKRTVHKHERYQWLYSQRYQPLFVFFHCDAHSSTHTHIDCMQNKQLCAHQWNDVKEKEEENNNNTIMWSFEFDK